MSRVRSQHLALTLTILLAGCIDPADPFYRQLQDGFLKSGQIAAITAAQSLDAVPAGNAVLGSPIPLARAGALTVAIRATRVATRAADPTGLVLSEGDGPVGTLRNTPASTMSLGVEAALGVLSGIPVGSTRILTLDALASLSTSATASANGLEFSGGSGITVAAGARFGIIAESAQLPGISVSVMRRAISDRAFRNLTLATSAGHEMDLSEDGVTGHISSVRVAAGKRIGPVSVSLGYGRDRLTGGARVHAQLHPTPSDAAMVSLFGSRSSLHAGASYALTRGIAVAAEVASTRTTMSQLGIPWTHAQVSAGMRVGR